MRGDKPKQGAEQYFTSAPTSKSEPREIAVSIKGLDLRFVTDTGVFSRERLDIGARALIAAAPQLAGAALDLGCGWGGVGVTLALLNPGAALTLSDVNERAVALARGNIALNGAHNAEAFVCSGVPQGFAFDSVFFNPPIRAGKDLVQALYEQCARALAPKGSLYVVVRKRQGAPSALMYLKGLFGGKAQVILRMAGYHVIRSEA